MSKVNAIYLVVASILVSSLGACGRPPAEGSRLLEDHEARVGLFSVDSDGNTSVGDSGQLRAFSDRFDPRTGRSAAGERRETRSIFDFFRSKDDKRPPPDGEPAAKQSRPLDREGSGRVGRDDPTLPPARQSGDKEPLSESYPSSDDAGRAFDEQSAQRRSAGGERLDVSDAAARALEALLNGSAAGHNGAVKTALTTAADIEAALRELEASGFKTPPQTEGGARLRQASRYLDHAEEQATQSSGAQRLAKEQLVAMARAALRVADDEYASGNQAAGDFATDVALALADVALGLTPGVGWAKDCYEAVTGKSLLTGEPLDDLSRALAIVGVVTGGIGSKFGTALDALRVTGKVLEASGDGARAATRVAARLVEAVGPEEAARLARHIDPQGLARAGDDIIDVVVRNIDAVDVKAPRGKATFWSGPGNFRQAEEVGGMLEATPGGKWLSDINPTLKALAEKGVIDNAKYRNAVWPRVSERFARAAEGDVTCFVKGSGATSVFRTVELPILREGLETGRVTSLTFKAEGEADGFAQSVGELDDLIAQMFQ